MTPSESKPGAIEKALDILLAFFPRNMEMGNVELSERTGFHIATVNRTLKILAKKRFLQQNRGEKFIASGPLNLLVSQLLFFHGPNGKIV